MKPYKLMGYLVYINWWTPDFWTINSKNTSMTPNNHFFGGSRWHVGEETSILCYYSIWARTRSFSSKEGHYLPTFLTPFLPSSLLGSSSGWAVVGPRKGRGPGLAKAGEGLRRVPKGSGCYGVVDSKCPPKEVDDVFFLLGGWLVLDFFLDSKDICFNGWWLFFDY